MKPIFLMAVISITVAASSSSKKENTISSSQPSTVQLDDVRTVLLKEIVTQSLPDPYFHFVYDSHHYVKQISFAAGFTSYNVEYENKRVTKMTNNTNGNFLLYSYHGNQVSEINEFSGLTGNKVLSYRFSYNGSNQLTQVCWIDFLNDGNGSLFKKSELTYQTDGNLSAIDHYNIAGDQISWVKTVQFGQYDNTTNVDDFYLLEDFFDTFLFLPQVKLQQNNPLRQQVMSPENDFEILYTYQYQDNLPAKKTAVMTQTRGTGNRQCIQTTNLFNYY